jgi:hypothetical protein
LRKSWVGAGDERRAAELDVSPLTTYRFSRDQIEGGYEVFANQRVGVVRLA